MDAHMVTVNDLALKEKSLYEKNAALTLRISKIAGEIAALKQQSDQICVGAVVKVSGKWAVASCSAGTIKDSLDKAAVNSARVTRDAASMAEAIKIVSKVMRWLDTGVKDGKEQVFTKSSHATTYQANGPAPAAMVALLEEAHASATSKVAQEALSKAMELVQAAKGSRISQVHSIFLKLIQRLEESRTKMVKYAKQVTDEANANAQTLFEKRVTVLALAATKTGEQSTMESTKAANTVAIASLPQQVTDEKALYMVDRKLREDNTKKCAAFMNFYDAETQTSTAELLILKKAIDIIRHIKCTTNPPTGAPTAFPTSPPTAFPTAQPTNAPTAYPTAAPTAAPTSYPTVAFCAAGDYKFMSKVFTGDFAKRSMYSVPVYAKGVTYTVKQLNVNKCTTIETSHLNRAGLVEKIKHQYKCCLKGGLYGSMATATASHDLCGSADAQYCELFGANMYSGNVDPSLAEVSAPTANPTAPPTAFPTAQPTAYPTAQPTQAPTAYPTAEPTAAPTAAIADSVDATTGYIHASKDLVHTQKIHLGDAAANQAEIDTAITPTTYPTAVPTTSPTAYPTTYPTATPTNSPTAYPTCSNNQVKLGARRWTGWINNWDGSHDTSCNSNEVMSGMHSIHDNGKEDRRFLLSCSPVSIAFGGAATWTSGWSNWDASFTHTCPSGYGMTGFRSFHDNSVEDRRFGIHCRKFTGTAVHFNQGHSGWVNGWDGNVDYYHNSDYMLYGMNSVHDNGKEDRLFGFYYTHMRSKVC